MKELQLEQFTRYSFLHGISYSPSGSRAAFLDTQCDLDKNGYRHTLYLYENNTFRPVADISPARGFFWQDDKHVVFIKSQSETETVLAMLNVDTKEIRLLPTLYMKVRELQPLGCGKYAVVVRIDALEPDYYAMNEEERSRVDDRRREDEGFTYLDELPIYCNGDSYVSKKRNALFIADIFSGECTRVTEPLFFVDYFAVEENTVYYAGEAYTQMPSLSRKIYKYTVGDKAPICIFGKDGYNVTGLSICGGKLWMFGNTYTKVGRRLHRSFYQVDKENGNLSLINDYQHNMMNSVASDSCFGAGRTVKVDGETIYFISTYYHSSWLMACNMDGDIRPILKKEGELFDFDIKDGKILLIGLYDQKLTELYSADASEGTASISQLSHFNEEVLKDTYIAEPNPLIFRSHQYDIEGWVLLPKDFDENRSYPAILDIHGGPNFAYGTAFYHEMQLWANRGFFVFFCNPEGSEGRGDKFMNISGRYGKEDYETIMTFTDEVIKAYPQIDTKRLCVTGGSYGGFMTNWIVGHTDRFCCAATQRSISNWVSMSSTGDHSYHFVSDQMGADLAEDPEKIWSQSPLKYVKDVHTPVMVFHSTHDYRCPLEQGIQWFCALAKLGVETKMCIVDGETHELSRGGRPRQRIRRLKELTKWMEDHTK